MMLPIDEHGKSGAWVYACSHDKALVKVRWSPSERERFAGCSWVSFHCERHMDDAFTHYLPASWVEQAGAMREALLVASTSGCELVIATDGMEAIRPHRQKMLDASKAGAELLTATEWPPKGDAQ